MRNLIKVLTVFLLVFVVGCSSDDDNGNSVADSVLSGKVQGVDFTAKGGKAFDSGDEIGINIVNSQISCDSRFLDYEYYISTYIEKKVGTNTNANVIFNTKAGISPLNVLKSTVIVESISESEIVLKIKSEADNDNKVEGKFTVPYCE